METRYKIGIVLLTIIAVVAIIASKSDAMPTVMLGKLPVPVLHATLTIVGLLMFLLRKGFFKRLTGVIILSLAIVAWVEGWGYPSKTKVKPVIEKLTKTAGNTAKNIWEMDVPESVKTVIKKRTSAPDSTVSNFRCFADSMMLVVNKETEYANKQFAVHFRSSQIPPNLKNIWVYFVDTTQVIAGTDSLNKPIVVVDTLIARVEIKPTANGDKAVWSAEITERGRLYIFLWFEGKSPLTRPYYVDVAWRKTIK